MFPFQFTLPRACLGTLSIYNRAVREQLSENFTEQNLGRDPTHWSQLRAGF